MLTSSPQTRKKILIFDDKFHPALLNGLKMLGLEPVRCDFDPDDVLLSETQACFIAFYDCLRYPIAAWRLKKKLRHHHVPLASWNRDAPHYMNRKAWRISLLDRVRLLDIYATHTLIDTRSFADYLLYLPNAANVDLYNLAGSEAEVLSRLRNPESYQYDVSFFGGMNGTRYKEDFAREVFLRELGEKLTQHGIRFLFREAEGMSVADQISLIQTSRINLNFGARCEYGAPVASGLPERCYGVPSCGGFLLCDQRTHAQDDFDIGTNWAEFSSLSDCVDKIRYYLAHFDELRTLAEGCYRHVLTHHTYFHRAKTVQRVLQDWHAGKRNAGRYAQSSDSNPKQYLFNA